MLVEGVGDEVGGWEEGPEEGAEGASTSMDAAAPRFADRLRARGRGGGALGSGAGAAADAGGGGARSADR